MINGVVVQKNLVAFFDELPAHFNVFHGSAAHGRECRVVAQDFFTGIGNLIGVVHEVLQLLGVLNQQTHALGNHGASGLIAAYQGKNEHPAK